VEFLIPCTIVFTAIINLFQKNFSPKSVRVNYFLALFFGLIHGMGFANAIRVMLASDQSIGWGLFGFNVGLEAGQVAVVLLILLFSTVLLSFFKINRREWVIFASAGALGLSLKMALERFPW